MVLIRYGIHCTNSKQREAQGGECSEPHTPHGASALLSYVYSIHRAGAWINLSSLSNPATVFHSLNKKPHHTPVPCCHLGSDTNEAGEDEVVQSSHDDDEKQKDATGRRRDRKERLERRVDDKVHNHCTIFTPNGTYG